MTCQLSTANYTTAQKAKPVDRRASEPSVAKNLRQAHSTRIPVRMSSFRLMLNEALAGKVSSNSLLEKTSSKV